jgi:hypothetical protein
MCQSYLNGGDKYYSYTQYTISDGQDTGQHVRIMLHSFKRYISPVSDVSLII